MSTIKIPRKKIIETLGEGGERWIKGAWQSGDSLCLHGAIRACCPVPGDAYLIEQVAARKGWGTGWNDDDATGWEDIRSVIERERVTDADLADTYGPQWVEIVALVRRAAVLTGDEARALQPAYATDTYADAYAHAAHAASAGDAYADAFTLRFTDAAAYVADVYADADAATYPNAATYAAHGVAARHKIGDQFTQADYDTLTMPWRKIIGPIHPDDTDPEEDQ